MRVMLIQPPLEDFYTTPVRLYPLGLLYAAGAFQKQGCQVQILDSLTPLKKKSLPVPPDFHYLTPYLENAPLFFKRFYRFGLSHEQILSKIEAFHPEAVGLAAQFTAYFQSVAELADSIKKNLNLTVFIGGNHASQFEAEIKTRASQIDFVLKGPAETSVPRFVAARRKLASSPGALDWKVDMPPHDLLEGQAYQIGRKNYISLTASRGCPFHCEFCSVHTLFGRKIEYRPIESVLAEMRWNYEHKQVRLFNFEDDNISFDTKWFQTFLSAVIADPVLESIELTAMNGICHAALNSYLLELMRQAGFKQINLAYVTRDPLLRQKYRRPAKRSDFEKLIDHARKLGFFITVYVIIGLPEQTYEEIKTSIDYLLDLNVLVGPSVFYLPPGSRLYDRLDLPESLTGNWNLYRSSAFALETKHLSRAELIDLFLYTREKNLAKQKSRPDSKN